MKKNWITKILWIIAFVFIVFPNAQAAEKTCDGKLEFEWNKYEKTNYATFYFTSSCEHPIYMNHIYVSTEGGKKEMKRKSLYKDSIRAYGVKKYEIYIGDLNQDLVGWGGYNYSLNPPKKKTINSSKIKSKKDNWWSWWRWEYLFILPVLGWILTLFEDNKKNKRRTNEKSTAVNNRSTGNLIEDLWEGKKPLGETFWLYFILINFIISFGSGFFSELYDNNLFVIPGAISNIFTMVAVWNSSTNYQLLKIKQKKPYGWAYAAKVIVVLNGLAFISQVVLLFE